MGKGLRRMEEIDEFKQVRRLCECLFPYRKNRINHNLEDLAYKVGVTKERLVALITKFQNYENVNKNIFNTDYDPQDNKYNIIEISLTTLGEYIVEMNEEYLWKQIVEDFFK
jgi:hypothetical protein